MSGPPGLVALTGATGFLGRRLVPALTAAGWRVRALARRPADAPWPSSQVEVVAGGLEDEAALAALTGGASVVIHAAGLIKARRRAEFFAVNVAGAERLARAAGAARVIQVSSLAAREPGLSHYAASKRAGEAAAAAVLGERLTVIRPPAIYGPGDRETLSLFQLAASSPLMPVPAAPAARLALAHVDDVAAEILDLLADPAAGGVFAVGGARPQGYAWREMFAAAAQAMGRTPRFLPVPPALLTAAGAVSEAIGALRGAPAIFTRGKARELLHPDWSVSPGEMRPGRAGAGRPLQAGFADTVDWYRQAGWLA